MTRPALALLAVLALLPVWLLVSGSLQRASAVMAMPPRLFPASPSPDNYLWALRRPLVGRWALNTAVAAGATAAASALVSAMAGYAFAMYRMPGVLWGALMSGVMVPRIALVIPTFVTCRRLGINGTLAAAVIPCILAPASVFIARKFFATVPRAVVESARIDGASEWQVLSRVVGPVSSPLLAFLALFAGIGALQDWIWQALQLQRPEAQTLLVGLVRATQARSMGDNDVNPVGHAMAVGVILLAPLAAAFVLANRYFTGGLDGALKD